MTDRLVASQRTERALAASERRYRQLAEGSVQGLVIHRDGVALFANQAVAGILGYDSPADLVGACWFDTFAPSDRERVTRNIQARVAGSEAPNAYEYDALRADGSVITVECRVTTMEWGDGPVILATLVDVSERSRAIGALAASEARFRSLVDHLPAAVYLKEPEGGYVLVNRTACEWNARPQEEMLGRHVKDILDGAIVARSRDAEAIAARHFVRYETRATHGDGVERTVEVIKYPIFDVAGAVSLVGTIVLDVSARAEAERARRELEAELQRAQKLQAVGQLTGGIAHDFNNLLGVILGYVELAREHHGRGAHDKLGYHLEQIRYAGERGRDLVSKMLTFSRGGGGEARAVDPAALVERCAKLIGSTLPSTIELHVDAPGDLPEVLADPVLLEQVVVNLCINARDAADGHGRIDIAVRARPGLEARCSSCRQAFAGDFVEIALSDTGHGISESVAERAFDPFFTTKEIGRGSGLGLSVVHGILHETGAHIGMEPRPGAGTVMRVWLARTRAHAAPRSAPPRATIAPDGGIARVLIVDDEPAIATLLRETLAGDGHDVTATTSPEEALRAYLSAPYEFDVLVTDQTMPRLAGTELARACLEVRPELPIALCTGFSDGIDADGASRLGIRWFLPKPIDTERLREHVRSAAIGGPLRRARSD